MIFFLFILAYCKYKYIMYIQIDMSRLNMFDSLLISIYNATIYNVRMQNITIVNRIFKFCAN